jgi:hypothetical protein
VHIRPQRLPPECLDRVDALADNHGIDRDFARRLAAELHRYEEAAWCKCPAYTSRPSTTRAATRMPRSMGHARSRRGSASASWSSAIPQAMSDLDQLRVELRALMASRPPAAGARSGPMTWSA